MFIISEFNPQLLSESDSEDSNSASTFSTPNVSEMTNNVSSNNSNMNNNNIVTYKGQIKSLHDALLVLEATRIGKLPTINRRLSTFERKKFIKPNSIFVWNETSCGMKRWTDGKMWSASKVFNNHFLIYYEKSTKDDTSNDSDDGDGLIKQSFSLITKDYQRLHLIYYFKKSQLEEMKASAIHIRKRKLDSPTASDDEDAGIKKEGEQTTIQQAKLPSQDPYLKDLALSNDIYPQNLL
ncbi:Gti1/Pac2 family-domain-containing protein, partial [Scheffersomyces amazonensis]|uniref:Gti1/Pac2 family-domain-containing protein n=1 Tax=Scheffersomyces amazonensis TaxID=1078765 RepID=UPI00315E02C7